jgi:CheY-like chemotaxis protein
VRVDATEFERAILNLAVNAKDAMPEGGHLTLTVRDATADELAHSDRHADGAWVVIEVADTGRGMSDDVRQRAFEPFFTTKGRAGGSGLGLSQVYGLCAHAGGFAALRSRPGAGTTVSLFLPCCSSADPLTGAPADEARFDGLRVLLVEDNVELAGVTVSLLENLGCKVTLEHDAAKALERIERATDPIDVVVSDILMPGAIDGHELAIELRRRFPALAVVLVTAYAAQATAARKAGFAVLTKPCPVSALAAAIRAAKAGRSPSAASGGAAAAPH